MAVVSGGRFNDAKGYGSTVSGGFLNEVYAEDATIGGGAHTTIYALPESNEYDWVAGDLIVPDTNP